MSSLDPQVSGEGVVAVETETTEHTGLLQPEVPPPQTASKQSSHPKQGKGTARMDGRTDGHAHGMLLRRFELLAGCLCLV